jgi:hypothetical protein
MYRSNFLTVTVTAVVLLIVAGFFSVISGQSKEALPEALCSGSQVKPLQWGDPNTDLDSCQQDCRSRYGVDFYTLQAWRGGGGGYSPGYYLYAQCIADCNKTFWNRFDRKTDELQQE